DIVVCASHKEGFGLPALEAMASKGAVIATKAGAWPEIIVDDENGYLVETKSSQQIADKLDMLISDSKLRYKIDQNGYDLVTTKYKI
ncbi:glycosyltransferase, partial [Francisella tularensis]|uniref:glycosyltransferase n=1 Tax=Francisella tularensis TaxID=263 RepID=UPI0023819C2D